MQSPMHFHQIILDDVNYLIENESTIIALYKQQYPISGALAGGGRQHFMISLLANYQVEC